MTATDEVNYARVQHAIEYLTAHQRRQPSLYEVAEEANVSPFHFQRLFTTWAGVSPKRFLQFLTVDFLKTKIRETDNLIQLADAAGLSSQSRVYDLFVALEGVTPAAYRRAGQGLTIGYGTHDTPFGPAFVAVADRGLCHLAFVEPTSQPADSLATQPVSPAELAELARRWPLATLQPDAARTAPFARRLLAPNLPTDAPLPLFLRGTPFQLKVWEALLRIPSGAVSTYAAIARSIGHPGATRAVGTAVGDNPVACLIPCHRVIRQEGILGQYRWGSTRKQALLGWEMAKLETT